MAQKVATVCKMKSRQETTSLGQTATVTAKPTISDKHLKTPTRDVLQFRWVTWDPPPPPLWQGLVSLSKDVFEKAMKNALGRVNTRGLCPLLFPTYLGRSKGLCSQGTHLHTLIYVLTECFAASSFCIDYYVFSFHNSSQGLQYQAKGKQ